MQLLRYKEVMTTASSGGLKTALKGLDCQRA
jgi:hypothetical protein